jgi:hypothetical protein
MNHCTYINVVLHSKNYGHIYKFYLKHILFDEAFKYGSGAKF